MQVRLSEKKEFVLELEDRDSAGMTAEQADAFAKNELRPVRLSKDDRTYARLIAEEHNVYPKAMYRLALKNGKPAGDEVHPSCPVPFDLAIAAGIDATQYKVLGKTRDNSGYLILRHPYKTKSVGIINPDKSINLEASRVQEKELLADGWVYRIQDIEGLPPSISDSDELDPLPNKPEVTRKGR